MFTRLSCVFVDAVSEGTVLEVLTIIGNRSSQMTLRKYLVPRGRDWQLPKVCRKDPTGNWQPFFNDNVSMRQKLPTLIFEPMRLAETASLQGQCSGAAVDLHDVVVTSARQGEAAARSGMLF